VTVNVKELARATAFYRDVPGLPFLFEVPGIEQAFERLGVDEMDDHVLWMGFFKDSEGNTLALMEEKKF